MKITEVYNEKNGWRRQLVIDDDSEMAVKIREFEDQIRTPSKKVFSRQPGGHDFRITDGIRSFRVYSYNMVLVGLDYYEIDTSEIFDSLVIFMAKVKKEKLREMAASLSKTV